MVNSTPSVSDSTIDMEFSARCESATASLFRKIAPFPLQSTYPAFLKLTIIVYITH